MYHVYVLKNGEGRLYVGHTDDLKRRLAEHQAGRSRWTRARGPWSLVFSEPFATRAEAMKREKSLKSGRLNQELRSSIASPESTVERVLPRKD